jgi:hypothetical protein
MRICDLVTEIIKRDIEISGSNPISNLSGTLSKSVELVNDRVTGWPLAAWSQSTAAYGEADGGGEQEVERSPYVTQEGRDDWNLDKDPMGPILSSPRSCVNPVQFAWLPLALGRLHNATEPQLAAR